MVDSQVWIPLPLDGPTFTGEYLDYRSLIAVSKIERTCTTRPQTGNLGLALNAKSSVDRRVAGAITKAGQAKEENGQLEGICR